MFKRGTSPSKKDQNRCSAQRRFSFVSALRMIEFEPGVIIGASHALFFYSCGRFLVGILGEIQLAIFTVWQSLLSAIYAMMRRQCI